MVPLRQAILEPLDDGLHFLLAVCHLLLLLHHGAPLTLVDGLHLAYLPKSIALLVGQSLDLLLALVHPLLQLCLLLQRIVQLALQYFGLALVGLEPGFGLSQPLFEVIYYGNCLGTQGLFALDVWQTGALAVDGGAVTQHGLASLVGGRASGHGISLAVREGPGDAGAARAGG
ncbi:hypothetical protein VTG60DRAFT_4937 [Thermothelomyces hinnuleus]